MLADLCALLLRFRIQEVAVVADIEKALLQVGLQEKDRDVTRFLWLKNSNDPITKENIEIYRFTRIPFGIISSQFILSGIIIHHLNNNNENLKKIAKDLYVDNLITGRKNGAEAIQLYEDAKERFKEMSMNLREWASNSNEVRKAFQEEDSYKDKELKVLGLMWNIDADELTIPTVCLY